MKKSIDSVKSYLIFSGHLEADIEINHFIRRSKSGKENTLGHQTFPNSL